MAEKGKHSGQPPENGSLTQNLKSARGEAEQVERAAAQKRVEERQAKEIERLTKRAHGAAAAQMKLAGAPERILDYTFEVERMAMIVGLKGRERKERRYVIRLKPIDTASGEAPTVVSAVDANDAFLQFGAKLRDQFPRPPKSI